MGNGRRYSITLGGTFDATTTTTYTWNYDLRTLIPESSRDKKFLVHSSFQTDNLGTDPHQGVIVGIKLPLTFNRIFPVVDDTIWVGIANPVFIDTNVSEMKYYYNETECFVKMIEYPEVYPLTVVLTSQGNETFNNEGFTLNLTFEEM